MPRVGSILRVLALICLAPAGCQQWFIQSADREVRKLIESRQQAALGEVHSADVGPEDGRVGGSGDMYSFIPHPVEPQVPESFHPRASTQAPTTRPAATQPAGQRQPLTLADALAYAMRHARDFQFEKEELYLSALALTLERHLWTPQFVGEVSAEFVEFAHEPDRESEEVEDFDRAMTTVAQVGVSQRLPFGGEVTARVINTLVRNLETHTTAGESGQFILEADIPLFRGAGRVALESRYQAERNLIYAVRNFERFRRAFLVAIASDYFDILSVKARIENARESERALKEEIDRSDALAKAGDELQLEADRARVDYLIAQNEAVSAEAAYDLALDRFKLTLGMPAETPIDVVEPELSLAAPEVSEADATAVALRYRLDLLNERDFVDDARRRVLVARNNLLPDFDFRGSVTKDTNPERSDSFSYNSSRTELRGELALEIPLDRKAERNDYRGALIDLRRAERDYDLRRDEVRLDVRDALRRIEETRVSMEIQLKNIEINRFRKDQATELRLKGLLASNRDKIEAENAFRDAKNRYARAQSDYRTAILGFLRDTGTLRVGDQGRLVTFESAASASAEDAP
ncbi:MAG: TolC family protein [Phycisphaerales bacterium]|nr:MAG: TolC family protein [Phycisphaerales bacterium]